MPAPLKRATDYSHPEQEAQQSAEAQHAALARAAPANPSATTATNTIALILFMNFLLYENECAFVGQQFCRQRKVQPLRYGAF
jgi:hypothetical protein